MVANSVLTIRRHVLRAALVVLAASIGCTHLRGAQNGVPLRVMTYNIQSGNGDLARLAETIRGFAPDVVGLQEVDVQWAARSAFADQARLLGEMLHMAVRFAPIYSLPGTDSSKPARQFGVALLSKHPIIGWKNDTLTRLSTQVQNPVAGPAPGLLEATIEIAGGTIRVFNTHLDYRADPAIRKQQVVEMLAHIGDTRGPTLVLGDMNATPEATELQPLLQRFRDTWQGVADSGLTYPAAKPAKRIDYILTTKHFRVRAASVPVTEASDHRPVLADLLLER
jgi:endonuclease/exonuclease/phosphatase family metal-dependent hydrolase